MSVRATVRQFRERMEEYLAKAVEEDEPCVLQRNGKNYAVVMSHEEWEMIELGRHLDAFGPEYRVSPESQRRAEELLDQQGRRPLTKTERRELARILKESDQVLLRRAQALESLR